MSGVTTGRGEGRARVPPLRRAGASLAVVVGVFILVVLTRWQPLLAGGPSVVVLAVVAAALSPPRRARRRRPARSAYPYPSVRQWTATRESLAHLPAAGPDGPAGPERDDADDPTGGAGPYVDRPLVRVLDPADPAGDAEQTMAIDMRPLLADEALLEQTMAIDMRGFQNDPGYGR